MMTPIKSEDELREQLAAIEHERWADWQKWCHKVLRENCPSPELEKVLERWDKQIATPYSELSDSEKASDMEQVDRYWHLITTLQRQHERELVEARVDELKRTMPHTDGMRHYNTVMARIAELTTNQEGEI